MSMKILSLIMVIMETTDTFKTKWLGFYEEYDMYLVLHKYNIYDIPHYVVSVYRTESVWDVEETYIDRLCWNDELGTILEKYNIDFNLIDFSEEEKKQIFKQVYHTSDYFPWEYFHSLKILDDRISTDLNVQTMYDYTYDILTGQIGRSEDWYLDLEDSLTWEEIKVIINDFCKECEQWATKDNSNLVYKHI